MSIDATRWAWKQHLKPTCKLVLLALADRAGESHECWPSTERLVKDTCLHRETVFAAIKELESQGLLKVTRVQGLGNKYQLVGVSDRHQCEKSDPSVKTDQSEKPDYPVGKTVLPQSEKPDYHQSGFSYPEPINITIKEPIKEPKGNRAKKSDVLELLKQFGIDGQLANDFIAHRKVKEASISKTALDGFNREAIKAGISIQDAVRYAIERNWVGFRADWYLKKDKRDEQSSNRQRAIWSTDF